MITKFAVDTTDLTSGTNAAKSALRSYGDEVERTEVKSFKLARQSTNLLAAVLSIRGAFSITQRVLEDFGIRNEALNQIMRGTELALNIVIAALAVYRSAGALSAAVDFLRAKAAFLAGIAQVSAATLFVGTVAAIAASLVAWHLISTQNAPRAQFGGIVSPRPGGTLVRVGEAGQSEAIIQPLRGRERGFGGGITVNGPLIGELKTDDPDYIMRVLGRRIQQLRASGA